MLHVYAVGREVVAEVQARFTCGEPSSQGGAVGVLSPTQRYAPVPDDKSVHRESGAGETFWRRASVGRRFPEIAPIVRDLARVPGETRCPASPFLLHKNAWPGGRRPALHRQERLPSLAQFSTKSRKGLRNRMNLFLAATILCIPLFGHGFPGLIELYVFVEAIEKQLCQTGSNVTRQLENFGFDIANGHVDSLLIRRKYTMDVLHGWPGVVGRRTADVRIVAGACCTERSPLSKGNTMKLRPERSQQPRFGQSTPDFPIFEFFIPRE